MKKTKQFENFALYIEDGSMSSEWDTKYKCNGCGRIFRSNQTGDHKSECMMLHLKAITFRKNERAAR